MSASSSSSNAGPRETTEEKLFIALMRGNWDGVIKIFKENQQIQDKRITDMVPPMNVDPDQHNDAYGSDTALHWAITYKAPDHKVDELVDEIVNTGTDRASKTLKVKNNRGDTPLHCAASRGSLSICRRITNFKKSLVSKRNKEGETPLFLAALNGHQPAFFYLHSVCDKEPSLWTNNKRDTILHCTIRRKYFDLSCEIIKLYKAQKIGSCFNEDGRLPLDELVSIPSAFKNGTRLEWWQKVLYFFICQKSPKLEDQNSTKSSGHQSNGPQEGLIPTEEQNSSNSASYQSQASGSRGKPKSSRDRNSPNSSDHQTHSPRQKDSVRNIKKNHKLGDYMMEELVKQDPWYKDNDDAKEVQSIENKFYYLLRDKEIQEGRTKRSTALLIAAKNGLVEQVKKILHDIPVSIHDELLDEKKNVVHVAIEERQSHVLEVVREHKLWHVLIDKLDAKGNNALHLAAKRSKHTTSEIRGSVMQMQWEIKWFEYVKNKVPPYFISQSNDEGQTPGVIFLNEHWHLINECNESVKDMCSSHIVAATLVEGAAFSACFQDIDRYGHTFSISLLISFLFSITSLAAFLSIYSTRKEQPKGFRRILPLKLFMGIISFVASLVSMLVSFYAALSHDFHPKEKYKPIISYGVILLPAALLYTFTQLPLYWHLFMASVTKVPNPRIVGEDNISGFFQPTLSNGERANGSA